MQIHDTLQLQFQSSQIASIFLKSFLPEINSMPMKRSSWAFSEVDSHHRIQITIAAADAIAYRATINALIQLAYLVEKTVQILHELSIGS